MYCSNCGKEIRDGAKFCDKCGKKLDSKGINIFFVAFGIFMSLLGVAAIILGVVMLTKSFSYQKNMVSTETSVQTESKTSEASISVKEDKKEEKNPITKFFEGEAKVELPSLVSFSKERMSLGNYEEAKSMGGFVQMFEAGEDTNVVQCIAEYKDILPNYGVTLTGTLSSNDGDYNYTCYTCKYEGDADIKLNSINFNDAGQCDLCFVVATKDGNAYVAAYVPEGISFVETTEKMKNGY